MTDQATIIETIEHGDSASQESLADEIAARDVANLSGLLRSLENRQVRRWVRQCLLGRLPAESAATLAGRLLDWPEDFSPEKRDRTTANVIAALSADQLAESLNLLAGSNAASALWDRMAQAGDEAVMDAVFRIFQSERVQARETALHLLVLDPYGPEHLTRSRQDQVLMLAMNDPDPEIRGLAAEVVAADMPEILLERSDTAPLDESERVRIAYWRTALAHRPDQAIETAGVLALDKEQAHPARRSALLALGENLPTRSVAPVLQELLRGSDAMLAEDAAQLMWRYHRVPDIANAAAGSQFESVRKLANRLLHPEMGSPAAGGSRPGDPTRTADIFQQIQPRDEQSRLANNDEPPPSRDWERGRG